MSLSAAFSAHRGPFGIDVSLRAEPGETLALLGPNGSGKSTALAVMAGLLRPDAGRVELDGRALDDPADGVRVPAAERAIGVVFQDRLLFPHLTAAENVAFPLRARGVPRAEARRRARVLLDELGAGRRAGARPADLSGGEAQRVALARALVARPRLLLLDEPLSALDARARVEIRDLLARTLAWFDGVRVLVTHDPVEASTLADRLVLLEEGRVTQRGTPREIRDAPRTPYAAELVGVNLFRGRLEPADPGAGRLATPDGDLVVAWPPWAPVGVTQEDVLGLLRPGDVTLFTARPETSARNVIPGEVRSVAVEGGRARVRLATRPALVAEVTQSSVDRLGLRPGVAVWAAFKAGEVDLRRP
jgi:molybdate transport system ATP-binding protein